MFSRVAQDQFMTTSDDEFLTAVLGAIQEGLLVLRDGSVVEVNERFCEMVGFERGELIGAGAPYPFVAPDDAAAEATLGHRFGVSGREFELTLMRRNGVRFPAVAKAGWAVDSQGEPLGQVITVRDVSQQKRKQDRLADQAATDELTGLLNRRSFEVKLAGEVARARRHERPLSLAIMDLDGFKRINDEMGHAAGDRVLAEVAARLGALAREGESMARIGGDEFGWVLPESTDKGAVAAVTRARGAIAGEPFRNVGSLSLSAGIAKASGAISAQGLIARADRALYVAKQSDGVSVSVN